MRDLVDLVERVTGHRFADLSLLVAAFTHPSWTHEHPDAPSYQRLEFLGDSVVGLCVSRRLIERFPDVGEGDLSDLRQRIVNTRTLGDVGRRMGLGPHVRLGGSERGKAQVETRILGDVVEALHGALLRDAGLDACQALTDRWLLADVDRLATAHASDAVRSEINRLQELTQARWGVTPDYAYAWDGPDHDRTYTATVSVNGDVLASGEGSSKKASTKAAARLALAILERTASEAS